MDAMAPWLLFGLLLAAPYPLTASLLARTTAGGHRLLAVTVTLALGSGLLSQIMLWLGLVGGRYLSVTIVVVYLVCCALGWLAVRSPIWRHGRSMHDARSSRSAVMWLTTSERWLLVGMSLVPAAVLFNAVYWPFWADDAVGIYWAQALRVLEAGTLPVLRPVSESAGYDAYPVLIPLQYALAGLLTGGPQESLAKAVGSLLALGIVPATGLLAADFFGRRAGWWSAALLLMTPTLVRWASAGYVDLPMAFFFTLAVLFSWRLWRDGGRWEALLAGLCAGLAAWTKNAGLFPAALLFVWWGACALCRRCDWRSALLAAVACLIVAGPWYLRSWLELGMIVPPTAWIDQADRSVATLLTFVTRPWDYLLTGWAALLGAGACVWWALRAQGERRAAAGLLAWMTLPFWVIWWLFVSYDPRFLLLFMPLLVTAGVTVGLDLWDRANAGKHRLFRSAVIVICLMLLTYAAWISILHKDAILANPMMGEAAKRALIAPR